jgi:hypothetical protein
MFSIDDVNGLRVTLKTILSSASIAVTSALTLDSSLRRRPRFGHRDGRVSAIPKRDVAEMAPGALGVSLGVTRIEGNGLLKVRDSLGYRVLCKLVQLLQALNDVIEGVESRRAGPPPGRLWESLRRAVAVRSIWRKKSSQPVRIACVG